MDASYYGFMPKKKMTIGNSFGYHFNGFVIIETPILK
jgi:hypothetical protein